MDGITVGILDDNKAILKQIETLVTTPTLINTDITQGAKYAIPLMCETNLMNASAEVSESLVITQTAKQNISDNVAPGSRSWHLAGYIIGVRTNMDELSNKYQPTLKFHVDVLWNWFSNGAVLVYKDGNARIFKRVVIKELQTSQAKDALDGVPFTMTLKEINILEMGEANTEADSLQEMSEQKLSTPEQGSSIGLPTNAGGTSAQKISLAR